ncbi:hypothetical protein OIU77_017457 [Salix suchowensis]|uniref:Ubiquitin thioesterase OTU n=1 Tax=Salix suchowensis TaxID=1278906 RepID=A0ABQ8ZPE6_9ROSI|nr:hypothetical protein OIU77_017457 [Salix suchowensis]
MEWKFSGAIKKFRCRDLNPGLSESLSALHLFPSFVFVSFNFMAEKSTNEHILEQLKHGFAHFELVSSPLPSISTCKPHSFQPSFFPATTHRFFARIGPSLGSHSMKKVEHYSVQKVTGDGRCLFRSLVKGMAFNKGISLNPREERNNADELRMAVKEVICDSNEERKQYEEAVIAITVDESLKRYCQRIQRPDFWGGESELLRSLLMNIQS